MLFPFLFYVMLNPLEYLQEKIPKGPTGINYQNLMLLAMLGWWLFRGGPNGRRKALPGRLPVAMLIFLIYTYLGLVLTTLTVPDAYPVWDFFGPTFTFFLRLFNGFAFFWLASTMLDSRKKIRWCLWAIGISMPLVWRAFRSDIGVHSTASYHNLLRFTGPFVYIGSNELAALFVIGFIFYLLFALAQKPLWEKAAYATAAGLYAYGVLYSYSRGAQLAVLLVFVIVATLRYRVVLLLLLLAFATQDAWVPVSVRERWEMTTDDETGELDSSAASRERFWNLAIELFERNPVTGHGVLSFKIINPEKMDTHNIYLRILAEQGLIGMAIFLTIWASILQMSWQLWRRAPETYDRQYGFALMMTTIALMACNLFGDRFSHLAMIGQYWVLVGMGYRLHAAMTGVEPLLDEQPPPVPAAESPDQPSTPHRPKPKLVFEPATSRAATPELRIVGRPAEVLSPPESSAPARPGFVADAPRKLNIVGRRSPTDASSAPAEG